MHAVCSTLDDNRDLDSAVTSVVTQTSGAARHHRSYRSASRPYVELSINRNTCRIRSVPECPVSERSRRSPSAPQHVSQRIGIDHAVDSDHGTANMNLDRTGRSYRLYALRLRRQCQRNDRRRFIQHNNRNERRRLSLLPGSISPSPCEQHVRIDAVLSRQLCD